MLTRMEGLAPARLIHVLARGRASAAWSHLYARHSPKLESWNASTRRNGPNTLLGSTAQHSNRQRDRRDQDSPDPESGVLPVTPRGSAHAKIPSPSELR